MKLLYCYVAFSDRNGNPRKLRGMSELDLSFSTTNIYHYDSTTYVLHSSKRNTPLPEHFWANGSSETNIYNINVIAGVNGSGKSTAIQYLIDLLNFIYHDFGRTLSDRDKHMRHDPSANRNLLLFDTDSGLRFLDLRQGQADHALRTSGFHEPPLALNRAEAVKILQKMKVINLNNTLIRRDCVLHSGNDERLRNNFVYDCTLGAAIGSDMGGYFAYEVYKQVAYFFEPQQAEVRKALQGQIPEMRLPRALRLRPLETRFERTISAITQQDDYGVATDYLGQLSFPCRLALLCVASYLDNLLERKGRTASKYPRLLLLPVLLDLSNEALRTFFCECMNQAEEWIQSVLISEICTGSNEGTVQVWDANLGKCLKTLEGHTDSVTCVAVLPDGRVVSGSYDRTLRVWDADSGQCLDILEGHKAPVTCVAVLSRAGGQRVLRLYPEGVGRQFGEIPKKLGGT